MNFAVVYLAHRAVFRVVGFFRHWYIDGSRAILHAFLSALEELDRTIALRVTLRHFFEPLYQDYSVIGRILGGVFRSLRVAVGFVLYAFVGIIGVAVAAVWYAVLPALIFYATIGF